MGQKEIEQLGFTVIATTKFADGVSFDAHYTGSVVKRFMVHGPKCRDYDKAMDALYTHCIVSGERKGIFVETSYAL